MQEAEVHSTTQPYAFRKAYFRVEITRDREWKEFSKNGVSGEKENQKIEELRVKAGETNPGFLSRPIVATTVELM